MKSSYCMGSFILIGYGKIRYLYKVILQHNYIVTIIVSLPVTTLIRKMDYVSAIN